MGLRPAKSHEKGGAGAFACQLFGSRRVGRRKRLPHVVQHAGFSTLSTNLSELTGHKRRWPVLPFPDLCLTQLSNRFTMRMAWPVLLGSESAATRITSSC